MPERPAAPPGVLGVTRRPSRREWRRALILFAVGLVGLVLALLFVHPRAALLPVGAAAPPVVLQDTAAKQVNVAGSSSGHPYIVEFFEAGCTHCQQAAAQVCAQRVPAFAVDAANDSAATVTSYQHRYAPSCTQPLLLDPGLVVARSYAVNVVPTVYLVVAGKIAYAGAGLDGVAGLSGAVSKVLGG